MSYFYESAPDRKDYHLMKHKPASPALLHFHAAYELLIVESGERTVRIGKKAFTVSAGEGCFVDAFCPHSFDAHAAGTEIFVFVGNGALFAPILSDIGGLPPECFRFRDFDLLHRVTDLYDSAPTDALRLSVFKASVELVLAAIASEHPLRPPPTERAAHDISAILRYIDEHFTEPLTLTSLSKHFGYSPQYLSRLFHRFIPMNITQYVNIPRINRAMRLINEGVSVTEAAFSSGFTSMPSFYRAFRAHTGAPPKG